MTESAISQIGGVDDEVIGGLYSERDMFVSKAEEERWKKGKKHTKTSSVPSAVKSHSHVSRRKTN
jgi:hypothetical protein